MIRRISMGALLLHFAAMLALLQLPVQRSALAQDASQAESADQQARAYFKVGAFDDAAKEFLRAYELTPKAAYLFNAGLAFENAGNDLRAIEVYERFLKAQENDPKVAEARARKIALEAKVAEKIEQEKQEREAREKRAQVQAQVQAASEALGRGAYAESAQRFQEAFDLTGDAEFLFERAEALRLAGNRGEALAAYFLYLRTAPNGANATTARKRKTELQDEEKKSESSEGQAVVQQAKPDRSELVAQPEDTKPKEPQAKNTDEGVSWALVGVGVGFVAAGLALDLFPETASNGQFDPLDVAPLVLYGAGLGFTVGGVF